MILFVPAYYHIIKTHFRHVMYSVLVSVIICRLILGNLVYFKFLDSLANGNNQLYLVSFIQSDGVSQPLLNEVSDHAGVKSHFCCSQGYALSTDAYIFGKTFFAEAYLCVLTDEYVSNRFCALKRQVKFWKESSHLHMRIDYLNLILII